MAWKSHGADGALDGTIAIASHIRLVDSGGVEITGGGYARQSLTASTFSKSTVASFRRATYAAEVDFGDPSGDWSAEPEGWEIMDGSGGGANTLASGDLTGITATPTADTTSVKINTSTVGFELAID